MEKNFYGFSLIEVIVATSIITISVFGVYKLISENTKIINKSSNNIQVNNMFFLSKDCIESIGIDNYNKAIGTDYYFNFGTDLTECSTGTINQTVVIDNLGYSIKGNILESGTNYIKWLISIESPEIKTLTGEFLQIQK
ncbi:MAG: prepilin-type N-terminal cleavage/methylation domain-containing protein [Candidatus Gracilibacteria bacterium]|nr:prepilin-type N-terminal cleavage/methylation domain-containing protein [Candidatus Gracilibacteria bacterium]